MDEREISRLFAKIKIDDADVPEGAKTVFSILVATTLRHRDRLKVQYGIILTVEDVRVALDWLTLFVHSRQIPATNNAVRRDLLTAWIEALEEQAELSRRVP